MNGKVLRTEALPVEDARLSSVFGLRKHPIYENIRMHVGVDHAAAKRAARLFDGIGTHLLHRLAARSWPSGRDHAGIDTMTRYAHLSAAPDGLATEDRVVAGNVVGPVGQTDTATAPNLRYEVHVDGRPIDPPGDDRLAAIEEPDSAGAFADLETTRTRFASVLNEDT